MTSPNIWGPHTWIFLHTLVSKLKEEYFNIIGKQIFFYIKRICSNLPCPECSMHSNNFFLKVPESKITSKETLINTLYVFHNLVNQRKEKPQFKYENIKQYENNNIIVCFNNFSSSFNTKGNMKLISQSFHRNLLLKNLRNWLIANIKYFEL